MSLQKADKSLIIAKIESAYGTDSAPTAVANAFLTGEPKVEKIVETKQRKVVLPWMGKLADINIGQGVEITFQHEVTGSGAAGTVPKVAPLLRACNLTETISAGVSVAYNPNSSLEGESVTIWFYKDGHLYKATGCRGSVKQIFKAEEIAIFEFKFSGLFAGATFATDATYPASITYDSNSPLLCLNAGFKFDTVAKIVENFSIDLGNKIEKRTDPNAVTGISQYYISNREVKGNFDPEAEPFSTVNYFTLQDASTTKAITYTLGTASGSKFKVDIANAVINKVTSAERKNIGIFQIDFNVPVTPSTGNNEVTFTFL